jgi:hypothetical protein
MIDDVYVSLCFFYVMWVYGILAKSPNSRGKKNDLFPFFFHKPLIKRNNFLKMEKVGISKNKRTLCIKVYASGHQSPQSPFSRFAIRYCFRSDS